MSFRRAAELARGKAAEARRQADQVGVADPRVEAFDRNDRPALIVWLKRRIAQEMDALAAELARRTDEDVTVSERGPRR
jgi:hypothetical protein